VTSVRPVPPELWVLRAHRAVKVTLACRVQRARSVLRDKRAITVTRAASEPRAIKATEDLTARLVPLVPKASPDQLDVMVRALPCMRFFVCIAELSKAIAGYIKRQARAWDNRQAVPYRWLTIAPR